MSTAEKQRIFNLSLLVIDRGLCRRFGIVTNRRTPPKTDERRKLDLHTARLCAAYAYRILTIFGADNFTLSKSST